MLQRVPLSQIPRLRPLLAGMLDIHLPIAAILAGDIAGEFYADDPQRPSFVLTWTGHRFYLAGSPPDQAGIAALRQVFLEVYRPQAEALGKDLFYIHYPLDRSRPAWERALQAMLHGRDPIRAGHEFYAWERGASRRFDPDWRRQLPEGIELVPVDASLLVPGRVINPDYLTEEMLSERPSVEEFLAKSFGMCLVHADEIIGWCLSEYNTGNRCEVGIATREDYRRRGLATLMTRAFIEQALAHGVNRIGWHCSAENLPSRATALKAGFRKVTDTPIFLGWFDPAMHLTQNGYIALFAGRHAEALAFFERSFAQGELPGWAYFGAACAAACLGRNSAAFGYLDRAVAAGFCDVERLRSAEHLAALRGLPAWNALLERLGQA